MIITHGGLLSRFLDLSQIYMAASPPPIKRKDVDEEEEGEERQEKDDGDLFINKLVDLLDWFAQQVRRERLKLHRQLSSVLQVGRSLFFESFFI